MIELDTSLAQYIVDRAMAILPHNLNVMDTQGMIIGSGDPARLHTRHEGAQLVLANQRVVEIDAQAAGCLQGVRAGVNLPLMHEGRLIGVLGITGDPEQVRPLAELLRMTAEMLVEQRVSHAERQWHNQQQETWLTHLLDDGYSLGRLQTDTEHLRLALTWPRQASLLSITQAAADSPAAQAQLTMQMRERHPQHAVLPLGTNAVLWLRSPMSAAADHTWLEQADRRKWPVQRLHTAEPVSSLSDLREACQALLVLRDFADDLALPQRCLALEDYRLAALLHRQRESWTVQQLLEPLERLRRADSQSVLLDTLGVWLAHGGSTQLSASQLGIHRNTLRYRLERIARLSGLDLNRADHRTQLTLSMMLQAELPSR
ncbi:sugar diacid recognition domain-containing protein [Halopseudomonas pelagia]|uniref:sugar diacid recognition domain-containing protein n=1 Tax=Halopseudomonas pelagia TaxID=553151 RepID=UPI0030D762A8|tara:strand:- start:207 stop:1328 length:1122 start_codon:yes stop_codon:yes gene_type:complete